MSESYAITRFDVEVMQTAATRSLLTRSTPRSEVVEFSKLMERKLAENDWKGGWKLTTTVQILERIHEELDELDRALVANADSDQLYKRRLCEEAADIANFCMMLFDNELAPPPDEQEASDERH